MWVIGGVPPNVQDISLFRGDYSGNKDTNSWDPDSLYFQIPDGKRIIADDGLKGEKDKIIMASRWHSDRLKKYIKDAKARQETFHTRLKSFNILGTRFRHGKNTNDKIALHKMAVEALAVVIQYDYENGHPPFDMQY